MAMTRAWSMSKVVFIAGAAGILAGCGGSYTSDYVPPQDGRARVVWEGNRAVAVLPDQRQDRSCSEAVRGLQTNPGEYTTYYGGPRGVVYYRPWIVVRPAPIVFVGSGRVGAGSVRSVPRTGASPSVSGSVKSGGSGGGVGSTGSGGGGGGGGGGGDMGKAAIVLAVVALLTLPIITLGVGLSRPEPEAAVAEAIDEVNAYNDLARLPASPCGQTAVEAAGGGQ
jgi:hypothetical protein